MQVGQVAGILLITVAFLLRDSDDWASVLAAFGSDSHLALRFFFQQNLDRIVRVNATELGVITQHFRCNLVRDAILSRWLVALRGR